MTECIVIDVLEKVRIKQVQIFKCLGIKQTTDNMKQKITCFPQAKQMKKKQEIFFIHK